MWCFRAWQRRTSTHDKKDPLAIREAKEEALRLQEAISAALEDHDDTPAVRYRQLNKSHTHTHGILTAVFQVNWDNNNNNNNNTNENVYGAVIATQSLREFTRFI